MCCAQHATAQTIDDLLDEQDYIEGLSELDLPEVLEYYFQAHPTDDTAVRSLYKMAMERMAMRRPGITPANRLKRLETIIAIRDDLIAGHPRDLRRATWLADQSAAWLFEMFHIETSGATALFGSPTPRQLETARTAARQAYELATRADSALADVLREIESQPDFRSDVSTQLQRQRLIDRERRRRVPLLRGMSAAVHAELNIEDQSKRAALYEEAAAELGEARDRLDGTAACHAALYQAIALMRLARFDESHAAIDYATTGGRCDGDAKFLANLITIELVAAETGPSAAIEKVANIEQNARQLSLLQRVLLTDQRFKWRRTLAMAAAPADRAPLLAGAYQSYLDLIDVKHDESPEVVRAVVVSRIANVVDNSAQTDKLPALVTVALAESKAREPNTRAEAIVLLERTLQRTDVADVDRAAALFSLGRVLYEDGRKFDASQRFYQLARDYPADSQAGRAIELAAALALEMWELQPGSGMVREALNNAVSLLLERFPSSRDADRWQYVAGELAARELRFVDASAHFQAVPASAKHYLDAMYMRAKVARQAAEAERDQLKRITLNEQAVNTAKEVHSTIEQALQRGQGLDAARKKQLGEYIITLSVLVAQSKLDLKDEKAALEALENVTLDDTVPADIRADVLLVRIKAKQAVGRASEAQQELQQYLDAAPDQIGAVLPSMMLGIETEVRELLEFGLVDEAQARAHRDLLPLANLLSRWLAEHPEWRGDEFQLRRRMAAAFELSGRYEDALREYDRLLVMHPDLLVILVGKAESLYQLGGEARLAESMQLFKRIGAAERDGSSSSYWMSQLRLLQILDQVDRNTEQIMPRIEQLEQRDPNLGGPRWQPGFNELRRKYRR